MRSTDVVRDDEQRLDPFWATVRRRHPDADLIVLPAEAPPERSAAEVATVRPDALSERSAAQLLGEREAPTPHVSWSKLPGHDLARRERIWTLDGITDSDARERLTAASAWLRERGWTVAVPPTGMPRVAGHIGRGPARQDVLLLAVPDRQRLVLRLRSVAGEAPTALDSSRGDES
ncbi:hypothetical protein WBG06_00095 [Nocardioides sp. CCNWLW239]|uniref:hypothetical protein n=1 Tax=Nocardioides sp. CCNWLW239 TaxID=3128902 RepID=UPI00301944A6